MARRHFFAAFVLFFVSAAPLQADPWSELIAAFFGVSPEVVEQRQWQAQAPANRISFARRLSGILSGAITHESRPRAAQTGSPRSANGSPRSGDNSPRSASASRLGSPRTLGHVRRASDPAVRRLIVTHSATLAAASTLADSTTLLPSALWHHILGYLSTFELRNLAPVNRFFCTLLRSPECPVWESYFRNTDVLGVTPSADAAHFLTRADATLHQLLLIFAPAPLIRSDHPPRIGELDPGVLHDLLLAAYRAGASGRILHLDPYLTFRDVGIDQRYRLSLIQNALEEARHWTQFSGGPPCLYDDILQLALRGFEQAQSIIVDALLAGRFTQHERHQAQREREVMNYADLGWPAAQQALLEIIEGLPMHERNSRLLERALRNELPAQERVIDNLLIDGDRETQREAEITHYANLGWPSAQRRVVEGLRNGVFQSQLTEEEVIQVIATYAGQGWTMAQAFLAARRFQDLQKVDNDRIHLLFEMHAGQPARLAALAQAFEPCTDPRCPRGLDTRAALYALAARGWTSAQALYLTDMEQKLQDERSKSHLRLIRWFFDLRNQLRKP